MVGAAEGEEDGAEEVFLAGVRLVWEFNGAIVDVNCGHFVMMSPEGPGSGRTDVGRMTKSKGLADSVFGLRMKVAI